jgi:hypothetical protein
MICRVQVDWAVAVAQMAARQSSQLMGELEHAILYSVYCLR